MSIVTNGVTIPEDGDNVIYDGVAVTQVICNGAIVWTKQEGYDITVATGGGQTGYNAGIGALSPDTIDTPEKPDTFIFALQVPSALPVAQVILDVSITSGITWKINIAWDGGSTQLTHSNNSTVWLDDDPALGAYLSANIGNTVNLSIEIV